MRACFLVLDETDPDIEIGLLVSDFYEARREFLFDVEV
jgi:hypothetical protein